MSLRHNMFLSGQFLQSEEWEKFQNSLGRKTFRIDDLLIIKMPLPMGLSYFYSPKWPDKSPVMNYELQIKKISKKEKAIFWRVEPIEIPPKHFIKTKDIQPADTLITDISKNENSLLSAMHPKTRYNIKLAERKGISITNYKLQITNKAFDEFYHLLAKTADRKNIKFHPKEYYKKLAEFNEIFFAYLEDKPLAAAMINFCGDTATYLHGGSSDEHKNLMAPYLLHWEIIKYAKGKGIKFYDWWGADEKKWPGVTRFKKGFGGEEIKSPGAYDLPLNGFLYNLYRYVRH